jgi:hypothetical protein
MIRITKPIRRAGVGVAGLALVTSVAAISARPSESEARPAAWGNAWLKNSAKHRQFFDAPTSAGGIPLVHMMNYYDTWNKAYGVSDKNINAVGTFYGTTTFFGVNDAMWAKYRIGEFLGEKDRDGAFATANPWRETPFILGMEIRPASIESLQKRGATFILCNNALGIFTGMLAKSRGLNADSVYADLKANILPGVELIPGMVVAIEQAHAAGLSYHRQ